MDRKEKKFTKMKRNSKESKKNHKKGEITKSKIDATSEKQGQEENSVKFVNRNKRRKGKKNDSQIRKILMNPYKDPHETPLKWWEKEPIKYA